jgi:hypothetical protein
MTAVVRSRAISTYAALTLPPTFLQRLDFLQSDLEHLVLKSGRYFGWIYLEK